jgi:signal transduction histidine kinase
MNEGLDGILQKSEQINALVSDLFTSTLDDLGEFKVNCRDEDSGVLAEIVKSCDDKHYAVMGELPAVIISIDKKRMAQVIGNIISNSYKYADTPINIGFSLSEGFLEMRLQDHGQGVPSDEIELITNKFYRGKAWADSATDGNGLGLYIAKMLMKKMNGDLTAESDGGLAITLIIPLS